MAILLKDIPRFSAGCQIITASCRASNHLCFTDTHGEAASSSWTTVLTTSSFRMMTMDAVIRAGTFARRSQEAEVVHGLRHGSCLCFGGIAFASEYCTVLYMSISVNGRRFMKRDTQPGQTPQRKCQLVSKVAMFRVVAFLLHY